MATSKAHLSRQQQWSGPRLCVRCGEKPQVDYSSLCEDHVTRSARDRAKRIERGQCIHCKQKAEPGRRSCRLCLKRSSSYVAGWRKKMKAQGRCNRCGGTPLPSMANNAEPLCLRCYLVRVGANHLGTGTRWRELLALLEKQSFRCPYTGSKIVLGDNDSLEHVLPRSRFPELGFSIENMQWVRRDVNTMKLDRTPSEFLAVVREIAHHSIGAKATL